MPLREDPPVRTVFALAAAATIAAAPLAPAAGLGPGTQAVLVRVVAQAAHDIGHNDWAFQSSLGDRYAWIAGYACLAVFWSAVAVWCRSRRLLLSALGAEAAAGLLATGLAAVTQWTDTSLAPALLRLADLGSPWWSCAGALLVAARAARADRRRAALLAAVAYAVLLAAVLLLRLPGAPWWALLPGLPAAAVALLPEVRAAGPLALPAGAPVGAERC